MFVIVWTITRHNVYMAFRLLVLQAIVTNIEMVIWSSFKLYYETKLKDSPNPDGRAIIQDVIYTERNIQNWIIDNVNINLENVQDYLPILPLLKAHSIMIIIPLHIYAAVEDIHLEGTYLIQNWINMSSCGYTG